MSTNQQDQSEEVTDSSQYIRTYAKDMAALSKQGGTSTPAPKPIRPEPPAPTTETTDNVTLPQVDESLITQARMRTDGEEVIDLNDSPTSGSVSVFEQRKEAPAPAPPAPSISLTPSPDATREAILARLKQRAAMQQPIATPAPLPPAPEPIPAPAPPPPPPPPPPIPLVRKPEPAKAEAFHSYSTDFANRIDTKQASTFSVLAAQSDQPRTVVRSRATKAPGPKPSVILASALIVLGLGAVIGGAVYFFTRPATIAVTQGPPSLIAADETKELEGVSGSDLLRALRDVSDEPLVAGNVLVTYVTSASSTPKGLPIKIPQAGGTIVKALPVQAPDILLRNIRPESTVGVVHAGNETRAFFILKVSSFERTFAGMLAWEPIMRSSLALLYPAYPAPLQQPETVTGTSTPFVETRYAPTNFVDAVVRNYDVRILRDVDGRSLMLYGYKDKETLIIARDEAAFLELVTRLNAADR